LSSEDIKTIIEDTESTLTGLNKRKYSGKISIEFNMFKGGITDAFMNIYTRMGLKREKKDASRTPDDK